MISSVNMSVQSRGGLDFAHLVGNFPQVPPGPVTKNESAGTDYASY
jgi:hypothetical protein